MFVGNRWVESCGRLADLLDGRQANVDKDDNKRKTNGPAFNRDCSPHDRRKARGVTKPNGSALWRNSGEADLLRLGRVTSPTF